MLRPPRPREHERPRPLVQRRDRLPAPRQELPRLQRRRLRRLSRADRQAGLRAPTRREHDLAAAVLPVAPQGRRLRHLRLRGDQPGVRHDRGFSRVPRRGARSGHPRDHRAGDQPHVRPAPLVPAGAPGPEGVARARLVRVERRPEQVRRHAHHLQRHRALELGVGSGSAAVLLAPLLQPPAGPQLRQPRRPRPRSST